MTHVSFEGPATSNSPRMLSDAEKAAYRQFLFIAVNGLSQLHLYASAINEPRATEAAEQANALLGTLLVDVIRDERFNVGQQPEPKPRKWWKKCASNFGRSILRWAE